jgi:hypothetical protein
MGRYRSRRERSLAREGAERCVLCPRRSRDRVLDRRVRRRGGPPAPLGHRRAALAWRRSTRQRDRRTPHPRSRCYARDARAIGHARSEGTVCRGSDGEHPMPGGVLGMAETGMGTILQRTQPEGSRSGPGNVDRTLHSTMVRAGGNRQSVGAHGAVDTRRLCDCTTEPRRTREADGGCLASEASIDIGTR